jgi:hypothetical protein
VVRGSVVCGLPAIGCPFLASGSRAREFWALALAAKNTVAAIRATVDFIGRFPLYNNFTVQL